MPKEKLLYPFFNGFSFPLYTKKVNWLKPDTPEAHELREEAEETHFPNLSQYEEPFHTKNNWNRELHVCGATSGHNIPAATCAEHSPVPAEFTAFLRAAG